MAKRAGMTRNRPSKWQRSGSRWSLAVLLFATFLVQQAPAASALDCPRMPEQVSVESKHEVDAALGRLGPIKAAELRVKREVVVKDLMGKLPAADRVYLEQMLYASFCSSLQHDKSLTEAQRRNELEKYRREMRAREPLKTPGRQRRRKNPRPLLRSGRGSTSLRRTSKQHSSRR